MINYKEFVRNEIIKDAPYPLSQIDVDKVEAAVIKILKCTSGVTLHPTKGWRGNQRGIYWRKRWLAALQT